jgi:hypothetical protein
LRNELILLSAFASDVGDVSERFTLQRFADARATLCYLFSIH